jgi:hypothetical protein
LDVQTDLDGAALISHYAAQLEAAGWKRVSEENESRLKSVDWTFSDSQGQAWRGLLWLPRLGGKSTTVYLQVYRPKSQ